MPTTATLSDLAQKLCRKAERLDALSATPDASSASTEGNVLTEAVITRRELLELAREVQTVAQTPSDFLSNHQVHYQTFACLRWLLRFDIFTLVPSDLKSISYESLASAASVPVGMLRSVTRMAITSGLFHEPEAGHIAHSFLSLPFANSEDSALRDWARFVTEYGQPSAAALADATAKWGATTARNETAYNVAFDTSLPFFEDIKQRPGRADEFSRYMISQARDDGLREEHLVHGFDWLAHFGDKAHVVDVGGSSGFVAAILAKTFSKYTFTVQDLPEAISSGRKTMDALCVPEDVSSRIQFLAHDFFQPQQKQDQRGPDAYLLRKILHDWPAERARLILSNLAAAVRDFGTPATRIVVMDTILPPPGAIPRAQEAKLRVRDLVMAQNFNAGERELAVWEELFSSAEPKLKLVEWVQPPGSAMAVMVAQLASE
ncbi:O-methyltransferase-domain-containing protein [Coniella lustricola]|uniref:O-methyltransferase-domain-containing protein n=1 Tax=Coniella lustricola TaxID=2025994 RepID=A0A2T3A527_9PEZI|nr:O-methyltransferase-domain-containing protein [Coniella lustricola]